MPNTTIKSIRIPNSVIERINTLANKRHINFSQWVNMTIARESKPRN